MRRSTALLVTTGIIGLCVPFAAAPEARADDASASTPAYGGYQADAQATPVRVEIYEPTIPIPVDPGNPELEFDLSFTRVHSQVGTQQSLGSWLWPGDSIGQGLSTFGSQLGLPPELFAAGYPVQVNSQFPGDVTDQRQEPLPGLVMRALSGEKETRAQAGFSTDSEISEGADDTASPSTTPSASAAPSGLDLLSNLPLLGSLLAGGTSSSKATPSADPQLPGIPSQLSGLIRISGANSTSRVTLGDKAVTTVAKSALGEVSLLGGIITMDGITSTARNTSAGTTSTSSASTDVGSIYLMGQKISFNDQGLVAPGQKIAIPGLPDQVTQLLATLGVSLKLVDASHTTKGATATAEAKGIVLSLDLGALKKTLQLDPLIAAIRTLTGMLPDQLSQLGSLIDTATHLAPKVVLRLGNASATTATVPQLEFGSPSTPTTSGVTTAGTPPAVTTPPAAGGGVTTLPTSGADVPASTGLSTGALGDNALVSSTPGLPALNTVPGLIFWGALAIAALAGVWLRRIGLLALTGGATCTHGCESGLPDLRAL